MQPRAVIPAGDSAPPSPGIFLRHGPHQRVSMGRPGAPWDTFGPSGNRSPLAPVFRAAECHAAEVSQVPFPTAGRFPAAPWESSANSLRFHADASWQSVHFYQRAMCPRNLDKVQFPQRAVTLPSVSNRSLPTSGVHPAYDNSYVSRRRR